MSSVSYEADITGDDSLYLLTDDMKNHRTNMEHVKFGELFPQSIPPDEEELGCQLNAPCIAAVLEPVEDSKEESKNNSRTASGKVRKYTEAGYKNLQIFMQRVRHLFDPSTEKIKANLNLN